MNKANCRYCGFEMDKDKMIFDDDNTYFCSKGHFKHYHKKDNFKDEKDEKHDGRATQSNEKDTSRIISLPKKVKWYMKTKAEINGEYISITQTNKDENKPEKRDFILLPLKKFKQLIERAEADKDGNAEYNIYKTIEPQDRERVSEEIK